MPLLNALKLRIGHKCYRDITYLDHIFLPRAQTLLQFSQTLGHFSLYLFHLLQLLIKTR